MTQHNSDIQAITEAVAEMDPVTQRIFLSGIRAFKARRLTVQTFEDRVTALVERHRAGGVVTVHDLYFGAIDAASVGEASHATA